jgi:hypothetical protein
MIWARRSQPRHGCHFDTTARMRLRLPCRTQECQLYRMPVYSVCSCHTKSHGGAVYIHSLNSLEHELGQPYVALSRPPAIALARNRHSFISRCKAPHDHEPYNQPTSDHLTVSCTLVGTKQVSPPHTPSLVTRNTGQQRGIINGYQPASQRVDLSVFEWNIEWEWMEGEPQSRVSRLTVDTSIAAALVGPTYSYTPHPPPPPHAPPPHYPFLRPLGAAVCLSVRNQSTEYYRTSWESVFLSITYIDYRTGERTWTRHPDLSRVVDRATSAK